jgi:hypothetical protein
MTEQDYEFLEKFDQLDKLVLDNDRIIKLSNLYTDEAISNQKKIID